MAATSDLGTRTNFQPNVEQTDATKLALRILVAVSPLVFYGIAALLAQRFRLNEDEHAEIVAALAHRDATAPDGTSSELERDGGLRVPLAAG